MKITKRYSTLRIVVDGREVLSAGRPGDWSKIEVCHNGKRFNILNGELRL
jgi:hypothetical protein